MAVMEGYDSTGIPWALRDPGLRSPHHRCSLPPRSAMAADAWLQGKSSVGALMPKHNSCIHLRAIGPHYVRRDHPFSRSCVKKAKAYCYSSLAVYSFLHALHLHATYATLTSVSLEFNVPTSQPAWTAHFCSRRRILLSYADPSTSRATWPLRVLP